MLTRNGKLNNSKFDWKDALTDALIMSGLTFFTSLGGMAVVGIPSPNIVYGAAIAGGTQMFLVLAMKRGLVKGK